MICNGFKNEMRIKKLVVGMLQTNCYILAGEEQGIIIDPGEEVDRILEEVGDLKVDLILLTHNHFDHIGALSYTARATSAPVAIHPLDSIDAANRDLKDGEKIPFEGEEILVIHTPGHTPGGCCFLFGENLFSGDTLFSGGWGNTAFPGGSERAIFKSIREKLMSLPDSTIVYPGHGDSTTIGEERVLYF
jgi:hydroxyacylglutathione hydrolase